MFSQSNLLHHDKNTETGKKKTKGVHLLLTPSAMAPAPTIEKCLPDSDGRKDKTTGKNHNGAVDTYVNDVMTVPASLAGIPAISVPFGESNGFPVGLQLLGQYGYDQFLLEMAGILSSAKSK